MRDEAPVPGVRGSAAMRRLANPVTLCESHSAFFLPASGQIRMPQALRRRPAPSSLRMTSARRVRSVLTNSGPDSRPMIAVETGEQTRSVVANIIKLR